MYAVYYLGAWIWFQDPAAAWPLTEAIQREWRKPSTAIDPELARLADDGGREP